MPTSATKASRSIGTPATLKPCAPPWKARSVEGMTSPKACRQPSIVLSVSGIVAKASSPRHAERRRLHVEFARRAGERRNPAFLGEAVLMDEERGRAGEGLDAGCGAKADPQ